MLPPIFSARSSATADFIFQHHDQGTFTLLPQSSFLYAIYIKLDGPSNIEVRCGGRRTVRQLTSGDLAIAPYRLTIDGADIDACEFLQLSLKRSVIDRAARELGLGSHVELAPVLGVVDPLAEQTIYQLEEELTTEPDRSDVVNLLIDTLAKHLVRHYAEGIWARRNLGGFPTYVLDRVIEYIEHNRDRNPSSQEIARVLGVAEDRFERAFKETTGKSIHQYLKK
jgi:AraC family transcriptional regulator